MEAENPITEPEVKLDPTKASEDPWAAVLSLPCKLSVDLNVENFTVRDLLMLDVETVIDSHYNVIAVVPVCVNGVRIGLAEFDVLRSRLAIRINELG